MKPSEKYAQFLQQSGFHQVAIQQYIIQLFDQLQEDIETEVAQEKLIFSRLNRFFSKDQKNRTGLYIWGDVGRGKTFLMDIFYQSLAIKQKTRLHFHQFMKYVHDELSQAKKDKDPIIGIARKLTRNTRVLCLDEFVVTDIGDAMLTGKLLKALFENGLVLVTTSNTPPEGLYPDGLQRARFLPAIDLLLKHCRVTELQGGQDFRMLGLKQTQLYQCPHDANAVTLIKQYLNTHLVPGEQHGSIEINGHAVHYEFCAEDTIWFSFAALCKTYRSQLDYLELAQRFTTLVLTDIEQMGNHANDVTRRFISLIDVLYDHRVKLICTAAVAVDDLYPDGSLYFEFQRCKSRLLEMQGSDYVSLSHRIK